MDTKVCIFFLGLICCAQSAGLLRTPKVYNAIITTDENLTPSRAYPVIQPTIHATYPFGPFSAYRFINSAFIPFNHPPSFRQNFFPENEHIPEHQSIGGNSRSVEPIPMPIPVEKPLPPLAMNMNIPPAQFDRREQQQDPLIRPEERPPIPLNEYGLPPSLVPLNAATYPKLQSGPFTLQPYPYNHYPLIYDSYNQYQDHLLPHYGYYPSHTFAIRTPPKKVKKPFLSTDNSNNNLMRTHQQAMDRKKIESSNGIKVNFDDIKNGSVDRNSPVPDVPPPPLPINTSKTQSPTTE